MIKNTQNNFVTLKQLKGTDPHLKQLQASGDDYELFGVAAVENAQAHYVSLIKNKKFLDKLPLDKPKGCLIFEEKFLDSISSEVKQKIFAQTDCVLSTPQISRSLPLISRPFYDIKFKHINLVLDGRQLGTAQIHPSALIGQNVFIGEHVTIHEGVEILPGTVILPYSRVGANSIIFANVTIYPYSMIGKNCRIHSGAVIGADGFGYSFVQGQHQKIWHSGGVEIADEVEIGANSSVDMGTFEPTRIGLGTKIDNGVQVGHNAQIGKHCILCGQVGISGSAVLEDYVVLGGKAGVGPDAFIGHGSQIAGGALVNESAIWPKGSVLGGHPARELKEWMKGFAYLRKMSLTKDQK